MSQHLCLFYHDERTLWQQCAELVLSCLPSTGRWTYITSRYAPSAVSARLSEHGITRQRGAVMDAGDAGLGHQSFQASCLVRTLESCLSGPASSALVFIDMAWSSHPGQDSADILTYEAAIETLVSRYGVTIVCIFDTALAGATVELGFHAHQRVCTAHGVRANPHYLPRALLDQGDPRPKLTYWLRRLDDEVAPPSKPRVRPSAGYSVLSFAPLLASDDRTEPWMISCFGALSVRRVGGACVHWDQCGGATSKVKTLFAYLLVRGDRGAMAEEIADLLWRDASDSKQSLNRLYHTVRCLRVALDPEQADNRHSVYVRHDAQRYFLAVPSGSQFDIVDFQEACYRGNEHMQRSQWHAADRALQQALALYQGDLFEGVPSKYAEYGEQDWCLSLRYWLRDMHHKALCYTAQALRHQGQLAEALASCDLALKSDPLSDMAHQEKMRTLAAAGRDDALHRQYKLLCRSLAHAEMGAPADETTRLFHALCGEGDVAPALARSFDAPPMTARTMRLEN